MNIFTQIIIIFMIIIPKCLSCPRVNMCPTCKSFQQRTPIMKATDSCLLRVKGSKFDAADVYGANTLVCDVCDFRMSFKLDNEITAKLKNEIIADDMKVSRKCKRETDAYVPHKCRIYKGDQHMLVKCVCVGKCFYMASLPDTSLITRTCKLCYSIVRSVANDRCLNANPSTTLVYCNENCFIRMLFKKSKIVSFERGCIEISKSRVAPIEQISDLKYVNHNGIYGFASGYCRSNAGTVCNYAWKFKTQQELNSFLERKTSELQKDGYLMKKCVYCWSKRRSKDAATTCETGKVDEIRELTICMGNCFTISDTTFGEVTTVKGCTDPVASQNSLDIRVLPYYQERMKYFNQFTRLGCIQGLCYKYCTKANFVYCNKFENMTSIQSEFNNNKKEHLEVDGDPAIIILKSETKIKGHKARKHTPPRSHVVVDNIIQVTESTDVIVADTSKINRKTLVIISCLAVVSIIIMATLKISNSNKDKDKKQNSLNALMNSSKVSNPEISALVSNLENTTVEV